MKQKTDEAISLKQRLKNLEKEMIRSGYTSREVRMLERTGCLQLSLKLEKEEKRQ